MAARTVTFKVELALAEGGREMREKRLRNVLSSQLEDLQKALNKVGYTVADVTEATYETERLNGRGRRAGSLI